MKVRDELRAHRDEIQRLALAHGATRVRIFGSVARGTERPESDIDLLIEPQPGCTLFDLAELETELERLLGRRVQVVSDGALKPWVRDTILREAVPV